MYIALFGGALIAFWLFDLSGPVFQVLGVLIVLLIIGGCVALVCAVTGSGGSPLVKVLGAGGLIVFVLFVLPYVSLVVPALAPEGRMAAQAERTIPAVGQSLVARLSGAAERRTAQDGGRAAAHVAEDAETSAATHVSREAESPAGALVAEDAETSAATHVSREAESPAGAFVADEAEGRTATALAQDALEAPRKENAPAQAAAKESAGKAQGQEAGAKTLWASAQALPTRVKNAVADVTTRLEQTAADAGQSVKGLFAQKKPTLREQAEDLTLLDRVSLAVRSEYSFRIISRLRKKEEVAIYQQAHLKERIINGKTCLTRNDFDLTLVDDAGRTNKERAEQGLPMLDHEGRPYELHHVGQADDAPYAVLTHAEHREGGNDSILHDKTEPSKIDRGEFNTEKRHFWQGLALQAE